MQKYKTEQNIDFYSELAKSLNNPTEQIGDNNCLITNLPLTENFITLECNHKFNYTPLVNDLTNHKYKFNSMERQRLKPTEIRCPYCRNIQKNLLPYYENMNVNKIHGVNFIDETIKLSTASRCVINGTFVGVCAFETTDISGNNCKCNCTFVSTIAVLNATYCHQHKYMALSKYLTAKKLQEKEDKKILVAKVKEEKIALAAKAKEEKVALAAKAKEDKKILLAKTKEDKKILLAKTKEDKKLMSTEKSNTKVNTKVKLSTKTSTIENIII